jgi:hypothetical protein
MLNIKIPVIYDFIKYFGTREIEEKAKQHGFIKRNDGKLQAVTFVKAFTIGLWGVTDVTLTKIAHICENAQEGLFYTKQALHPRLKHGVELLKDMFVSAMDFAMRKAVRIYESGLLSKFNNIYLCDATSLCLPDKLRKDFGGHEGLHRNKKAFLKIQTLYNIATRSFKDIQIRKATENDKKYLRDIFDILKKGDLIIYDLGYFCIDIFRHIASIGGYYVSRVQSNTIFYANMEVSEKKPMNIKDVLKKSNGIVDMNICIGKKRRDRIETRILAIKLPANIANERIRRANKNRKRSRGALTDYQKMILSWNIVITNAPEQMLSLEEAINFYKMRWQIEIMYKAWKSHLRFSDVGFGGKAQQECLLYGRLIVITLMTTVYSKYYHILFSLKKHEISILKFFSLVGLNTKTFLKAIIAGIGGVKELMDLFSKIALHSIYEKRIKRKTTLQQFTAYLYVELENCG